MQNAIVRATDSYLSTKHQELVQRRERLIHCLGQAARAHENKRTSRFCREIRWVNEFLESLDQISSETTRQRDGRNHYAVSSLFLHQCFKELTADEAEQFIFITGSEVDGVRVLDQAIPLEHAKRTMMGVTADTRFTHRILIKLEQFGHRLLAHFHSHPGRGADSTMPSGTDEKFQQRLESAGHVAVAAIFSRDGYVRFFRLDRNLEIEIYGEGVEKHDANVYCLTNIDKA